MKILHVVYSFPPDPPGGTEIYVDRLCRELQARGVDCAVVAPGATDDHYRDAGLEVWRFGTDGQRLDLDELYGDGDPRAAAAFTRILERERPQVVHQHALTPACSVLAARAAKRHGAKLVFTYHTPTVSCSRGTLLEWGRQPCDGRLGVARCAACALNGLGVSVPVSRLLARTPVRAGELAGRLGLAGGGWTALRMRSLMRRRHQSFHSLVSLVDMFIALAPWVHDVLRLNGVAEQRITNSAHGLPRAPSVRTVPPAPGRLRVAHVGRLDPAKGTRLLVQALRQIPGAPIDLDIFGVVQSDANAALRSQLLHDIDGDARIRLHPAMAHGDLVDRLGGYDLVAVPSQWLETGPLVVLEAAAAGVPVLGSDLGGLADKVVDGVDGLLVRPYDATEAWRAALQRCASDAALLARLRRGIRPPRSMADVAAEMAAVYARLADNASGGPSERPSPATAAASGAR
jgi:glycosyltransferase involved in cell wall biosynthesis